MTRYVGIDPSTKTGVVILNENGNVEEQLEIVLENGILSSAEQLQEYGREIANYANTPDVVCIEGFSFGSKGKAVSTQYGIGFAIRFALRDMGIKFIVPTPGQVKKFATGSGSSSKDNMVLPIFKKWGFEHDSDNVRDAFILAQIARSIRLGGGDTKYQQEVIQTILAPPVKKKKKA
ncbi:hypothetical protein [Paenibacillus sp. 1-18]|uniref:hypothetical protein n=1 Tax=Paenibacillus sp. 1-18 TaxID=1333846 RepID=UPI0004715C4E|nr:hypothetical protein [Paenibacillus sp. 1-18]